MRQPQHAAPAAPSSLSVIARLVAAGIGVVLIVGLTATADAQKSASASTGAVTDLASDSALFADGPGLPQAGPVAPDPTPALRAKRPAAAAHRQAPKTKSKAKAKPQPKRAAVKRWLPTGTGMWLHEWDRSNGGNAKAIVKRARAVGVTTLFVRGWSKKAGYEARRALPALLPATKGTNVRVVVWEFVYLENPVAEARRLAASARIRVPGAPRVAAVAPDIETGAEGTRLHPQRVRQYMQALRKALPRDVAILGTVPWPSEQRIGRYPYGTVAGYSDAILPMTYWYNRGPGAVTQHSVRWLRRFHKPVMPVGQGYDGRLDAPWLPRVNLPAQVGDFLTTARRNRVPAVSLWSWQTAPGTVWGRLSAARGAFVQPGQR